MITIRSNIAAVLHNVRAFERGVPAAIDRAFAERNWRPLAEQVALETLYRMADSEQEDYIPGFLMSIGLRQMNKGMRWRMKEPAGPTDWLETEERIEQVVRRWVEEEKAELNDPDVDATAVRLLQIMRSPANVDNAEVSALKRQIDHFAATTGGVVDPEMAWRWLRAVLDAWTEIVLDTLPAKVLDEIRSNWQ